MKKKILIAVLAAFAVATVVLTGCNSSSSSTSYLKSYDASASMAISDVHETGLAGLCDYLSGNGCLADYSLAQNGKYYEMMADLIGAKDGRKYYFLVGDNSVVVELYEFDLDNLNDTAKTVLQGVRDSGSFAVYGDNKDRAIVTVTNCEISDNGKYIMINSDIGRTDEIDLTENEKLSRLFQQYAQEEQNIVVTQTAASEDKAATASTTSTTSTTSAAETSSASTGSQAASSQS